MHWEPQDKRTPFAARRGVEQLNVKLALLQPQQQLAGQLQQQQGFSVCEGDQPHVPDRHERAERGRLRSITVSHNEAHLRWPVSGALGEGNKQKGSLGPVARKSESPGGYSHGGIRFIWLLVFICFLGICAGSATAATPHALSNMAALDTRIVFKQSEASSGNVLLDNRARVGVLRWGESEGAALDTGGSLGIPVVQSISPQIVPALNQRQWITVNGLNFEQGAVVLLRTGDEFFIIPEDRAQWISSQEMRIFVNVTTEEAAWTVQVVNPGGQLSPALEFSVGAPDLTPVGAVDFGLVPPGQTASRTFIVRNRDLGPATLHVAVSAPFSVLNGPFSSIAPGGQQDVIIRYAPSQSGSHDRTVTFAVGSRSLSRTVNGRSAIADLPQTNEISGIVYRETSGAPVPTPGAHVYLLRGDENLYGVGIEHFFHVGRKTQTDSLGRFKYGQVDPGDYRIYTVPPESMRRRYDDTFVTVTMSEGMAVQTNITLSATLRTPITDPKKLPIILVRGRGEAGKDEAEYWEKLRDHLRASGFKEVWDPNEHGVVQINGQNGIDSNAEALRSYINGQLANYVGLRGEFPAGMRIVAHSMGGLIVRQYLYEYEDEIFKDASFPPITEVIMLGTPHAGTLLADLKVWWDGYFETWQTNLDLRTAKLRSWPRKWPNQWGVRLYQLGGITGTDCFPTVSTFPLGDSFLFWRSPSGDKLNDGAVTLLSTRGQYISEKVDYFLFIRTIESKVISVFGPSPDLSYHQYVSLNHGCIKKKSAVLNWVEQIFERGVPPQISASPDTLESASSRKIEGSLITPVAFDADPEVPNAVTPMSWVLFERIPLGSGDVVAVEVNIDSTDRAEIILSQSSTSTVVRVEDPSGNLCYQSSPEINSNLLVNVFSDADTLLRTITVLDPEPGLWRIVLDGAGSSEAAECHIEVTVESPLVVVPSVAPEIVMGMEIPVLADMLQDTETVVASNIAVEITFPSGISTNIILFDDGEHADRDADDGLFGTLLAGLDESGIYEMIFRAAGYRPDTGDPYQRLAIEFVTVSESGGFIVDVPQYEAINGADNGFAEAIRVDVLVHVDDPGDYTLSGRLVDEEASVEMRANTDFTRTEGGSQVVSLLFTFHDLPEGKVYGPFVARELRLFRNTPEPVWMNSLATGPTVAAQVYSPYARRIRVTGTNDFGGVRVGTQLVHQIVLHNDGWDRMTVAEVTPPSGFTATFSGPIDPGGSVEVPLVFAPEAEIEYGGNMEVISDATAGDGYLELGGVGLPEAIPFVDWLANAGVLEGLQMPGDDAAGDGIANLLAYAFNIDPVNGIAEGDHQALPAWMLDLLGGDQPAMILEYRLYKHAVDITLDVQAATSLQPGDWTPIVPDEIIPLAPDPVTGDPRYRVRILLGSDLGGFMRLRVVLED